MISTDDVNRLLSETFEHMKKNYNEDGALDRWADERGLGEEPLNYILSAVATILMSEILEVLQAMAAASISEPEEAMEQVQELFEHLRSGTAIALILGLEIERQYLQTETVTPEVQP